MSSNIEYNNYYCMYELKKIAPFGSPNRNASFISDRALSDWQTADSRVQTDRPADYKLVVLECSVRRASCRAY
jgi:hypothetical protein